MASILLVDDSASMREMVTFTLTDAGHKVKETEDGVEALQFAKGESVDLVITDVNMPKMDGITLTRELRALDNYKFTPILTVVLGMSEKKVRETGIVSFGFPADVLIRIAF